MFKQISAKDLKDKLVIGDDLILLDVRQSCEHDECHIPNSILIPLDELAERYTEIEEYKEKEIVVYCKAGVRSRIACQILKERGFFKIFNLDNGVIGWKVVNIKI